MRIALLFFAFFAVSMGSAQADSKFLGLFWCKPKDFTSPYVENGRWAHPRQWDQENWALGDWVADSNDGLARIQHFYEVGVLTDQYEKHGIPILEVGSGFYHLSGRDQRRVLTLVDEVYNITTNQPGVFQVRDWKTDNIVGIYSKAGFANE